MHTVCNNVSMIFYTCVIQYNSVYDVAISGDRAGLVEYWAGPSGNYAFPKNVLFEQKLDTDLYEFVKVCTCTMYM